MRLPKELSGGLLLTANTVLILCLAFPVQILIARYLGPEALGGYAFVLSFGAISRVFVALNLQDVLIPLFKKHEDPLLFSNGWILQKLAALFLVTAASLFALGMTTGDDPEAGQLGVRILIVVAATLFFDHEVFSVWCKSEGHLWDYVKVDFGGTLVGLAARLLVIQQNGSIELLLATYVLEQAGKVLIAVFLYKTKKRQFFSLGGWTKKTSRVLFSRIWPIWLGAILTVTYARLDQILLGSLLPDSSQLGHYSVAVRLVEAMTAGAVALFIIYLPILSEAEEEEFSVHLQRLTDLVVWGSLLIVVPLIFLLKPIVIFLYGPEYEQAGELVVVYLLGLPAISLGITRAAFMYPRGLQRVELVLKCGGVLANLGFNILLIPKYGAMGAVWATVVIQWMTSVVANPFLRDLRPVGLAIGRAVLLPMSAARLLRWLQREN